MGVSKRDDIRCYILRIVVVAILIDKAVSSNFTLPPTPSLTFLPTTVSISRTTTHSVSSTVNSVPSMSINATVSSYLSY